MDLDTTHTQTMTSNKVGANFISHFLTLKNQDSVYSNFISFLPHFSFLGRLDSQVDPILFFLMAVVVLVLVFHCFLIVLTLCGTDGPTSFGMSSPAKVEERPRDETPSKSRKVRAQSRLTPLPESYDH